MALAHVLERHAEEAAELWSLRTRAAVAPHYGIKDLTKLDGRIHAHLVGLRVAPREGKAVVAALELSHAGVAFARAVTALELKDSKGFAKVLEALDEKPELIPGVVSALAWVPLDRSSWAVRALMHASCPPILRRFGLSAHIAHRSDPGVALDDAVRALSAPLRATAISGAGQLGRAELVDEIREDMANDDEGVRRAAAFASALLGEDSAPDELWKHADVDAPHGREALALALARMGAEEGLSRLRGSKTDAAASRKAIVGAGLLGAPEALDVVMDALAHPEHARAAGEAFHRITGVPIAGRLKRAPDDADELTTTARVTRSPNDDPENDHVDPDPDDKLAWPDVGAVRAAHAAWSAGAAPRERLLFGKPITVAWCDAVLASGSQRARATAAIERVVLSAGQLVDVERPAYRRSRGR
ncbi:MAG: TIGR02270 family protein [Polyangiaceae bacterium]